ncbi:hypothetical protein BSR28_00065 [Boudabousia liubingyangii]|nr:hypothetical protein BSR28_00065 [Boudabousia liubingyangii]
MTMFKKYASALGLLLFALLMGILSINNVIDHPQAWRIALHLIGVIGLSFMSGAFLVAGLRPKDNND